MEVLVTEAWESFRTSVKDVWTEKLDVKIAYDIIKEKRHCLGKHGCWERFASLEAQEKELLSDRTRGEVFVPSTTRHEGLSHYVLHSMLDFERSTTLRQGSGFFLQKWISWGGFPVPRYQMAFSLWHVQDSNSQPMCYESACLTTTPRHHPACVTK